MASRPCDGSDDCVLFHHLQLLRDAHLAAEHYKLYLDSSVGLIDVVFADAQGLQHSLVTLRQIFSPRGQVCPHKLAHLEITDGPQYSWRGLMVDVARHYIPLPMIKRTIDAMALSKFNTLHLHLTDAQSFPVLLDDVVIEMNGTSHFTLPLSQLANKGAFAKEKQYTKEDLREIVEYAAKYVVACLKNVKLPLCLFWFLKQPCSAGATFVWCQKWTCRRTQDHGGWHFQRWWCNAKLQPLWNKSRATCSRCTR
jgi:hexosaminidase